MPVWFKCSQCGEKYYTAQSKYTLKKEQQCEKCGAKLDILKGDTEKDSESIRNFVES
ncbi:MAG: hypothetical protein ACOC2G_02455 [Bacillota bacterium]